MLYLIVFFYKILYTRNKDNKEELLLMKVSSYFTSTGLTISAIIFKEKRCGA